MKLNEVLVFYVDSDGQTVSRVLYINGLYVFHSLDHESFYEYLSGFHKACEVMGIRTADRGGMTLHLKDGVDVKKMAYEVLLHEIRRP
jgi:hypothetical protein